MATVAELYPELTGFRSSSVGFGNMLQAGPTNSSSLYEDIPDEFITGISVSQKQLIKGFYQQLLRDIGVSVTTPFENILRILNRAIGIVGYTNLLTYTQKKYPSYSEGQQETVLVQFCKIYNCYKFFEQTKLWPPPNYLTSEAPLYTITGVTSEDYVESDIRVLTQLMKESTPQYTSLLAFFDAIGARYREKLNQVAAGSQLDIIKTTLLESISGITDSTDITRLFQGLYKADTLDRTSYKILQATQGAQRLFGPFNNPTISASTILITNSQFSSYSELGIGLISSLQLKDIVLYHPADRNQAHFLFFPKTTNTSSPNALEVFDSENSPITLKDVTWIQFNYDFPYGRFEDKSSGLQVAGVFQGYRAAHFPNPMFLIALSRGVLSGSDRMRAMWPEWFETASRMRWIDSVMKTWMTDIAAMPATTLFEKNMKEVQQLYYKYAQDEIYKTVAPFAMMNFQSQIAAPPPASPLPAMLSRINMNANTNANAAYQRFEQGVRPLLQGSAAASVKARRRGFFTGESKNSYRRTLKGQLYKLMRNAGARFTTEDALAEIPYIAGLAANKSVTDAAVYDRMKDWVRRYVTDAAYGRRDTRLDAIANLFVPLTPSSRRTALQQAATAAAQQASMLVSKAGPTTEKRPGTVTKAIVRYRKLKAGQGGAAAEMEDAYNLLTLTGSIDRQKGVNPEDYEGLRVLDGTNGTGRVTDDQLAQLAQWGGRHKTARHTRMGRRHRQKTRKQRGGAATAMPLAWYQQGAQFQGTVADPTGVGLAGSNAAWARSALPAQGGGRRSRQQMGGFYPSVMGAGFASAEMRLLPAAAYMGYNQMESYKKNMRKTHRRSRK